MIKEFNPLPIDYTSKETTEATVKARIQGWNTYFTETKSAEIDPLFQAMKDAKTAYFTTLTELKQRAHQISQESVKLQEHITEQYAPGVPISRLDISYGANRSAYINVTELNAGKVTNN